MRRTTALLAVVGVIACGGSMALAQAGDPFKNPAKSPDAPAPQAQPEKPEPGKPEAAKVDLRPKFKKGQQLRYVMEIDGKNKVTSKSEESLNQDQTMSQRIGLVMRVKEAGDDGATLEVVYESIKVVMDTPAGKMEFDSTKGKTPSKNPPAKSPPAKPGTPAKPAPPAPAANPDDAMMNDMLAQIIGPMVGTTLEVKTDRDGAITSVTGGAALSGAGLEGLAGGMGGAVPDAKSASNWLIGGVAGNKGFARVGETWTNTDNMGGTPVGGFRMVTTHTLKSYNANLATVMFTGRAEPGSEGSPGGGMINMKGAGYRGQYLWDTSGGWLREMSSELTTEMGGKVGGNDMEMSSSTVMRVKKQ